MSDHITATLADLDARLRELEAVQALILRILSTTQPLDRLLEQYGATEAQQREFHRLLDELVTRMRGRLDNRPSFAYFQMQLESIFPSLRGNREFIQLVLDTLKLERPAYRELYDYVRSQGWPTWT